MSMLSELIQLAQTHAPTASDPANVEAAQSGSRFALRLIIAPTMGVFFVAFFASIVITPIMRHFAVRFGIIDWPDLKRKAHPQAVAYLGGVGIFLGWSAGVMSGYLLDSGRPFPIKIILGATAITITGFIDDVYGIRARVKVGGQLIAAAALAAVTFTGVQGQSIGAQLIDSSLHVIGVNDVAPWLIYVIGTMVIAVFVLGGCNAVNLIDGLDGLAAGVVSIAAVGFLLIAAMVAKRHIGDAPTVHAMLSSDTARITMCLALLGALLGFIPYNFKPATIFMGDAGSLLLGYLSVSTILMFADSGSDPAQRTNTLKVVAAGLIVFAIPITDTSLAIFRRKMQGRALFAPDSQHMHHLLRKRGLSVRKTVLILYGLGVIFATLGVAMIRMDLPFRYVAAVFVVIYGFIMVMAYKYAELSILSPNRRTSEFDHGQPEEKSGSTKPNYTSGPDPIPEKPRAQTEDPAEAPSVNDNGPREGQA